MVFSFRRDSSHKTRASDRKVHSSNVMRHTSKSSSTAGQSSDPNQKMTNVLLVGQIYHDTIITVDTFPEEDSKSSARQVRTSCGGNIGNTGQVLAQFPKVNVFCMSPVGRRETSSTLISELEATGINTSLLFHRKKPTPSSCIIYNRIASTYTVISNNDTDVITRPEFSRKLEMARITKTISFENDSAIPFSWVHFEGQNIENTIDQIDWLDAKAKREGWRSRLTISVELEKPDLHNIDALMTRGDIVFFSKQFAEKRGYNHPSDFLQAARQKCKRSAGLFCTWGSKGVACIQPDGQEIHASALPVSKVEDAIGVGDAFIAGIIFTLGHGYTYLTALRFSCELASRKVAQTGFSNLANVMAKVWDSAILSPQPPSNTKSPVYSISDCDIEDSDTDFTLSQTMSRMSNISSKPIL